MLKHGSAFAPPATHPFVRWRIFFCLFGTALSTGTRRNTNHTVPHTSACLSLDVPEVAAAATAAMVCARSRVVCYLHIMRRTNSTVYRAWGKARANLGPTNMSRKCSVEWKGFTPLRHTFEHSFMCEAITGFFNSSTITGITHYPQLIYCGLNGDTVGSVSRSRWPTQVARMRQAPRAQPWRSFCLQWFLSWQPRPARWTRAPWHQQCPTTLHNVYTNDKRVT